MPIGEQILRGLRTAALFAEPPGHRLDRLALENRTRATDTQIANSEQRLELARRRDERFEKESKRRNEREDLATKLELASKGKHLTPAELQAMQSGELLGLDMGSGVNVGPAGGTIAEYGDDSFFIPGQEAQQQIDLRRSLERQAALDELRKVPLPGKIANAVGMQEGTLHDPAHFDDLLRAAGQLQPDEPTLDKSTFTDENDNAYRVFINPETQEQKRVLLGKVKSRTSPGGLSASEQRIRTEKATKVKIEETASGILLENGGDPTRAIADLARQARSDETGFIEKNLTKILRELKALERTTRKKTGGGLPPELQAGLMNLGGGPAMAPGTVRADDTSPDDQAAEDFLNRRFGGR